MSIELPQKKPHKGIYLLPNLFTIAAMFFGFYAIIAGTKGRFEYAAIAIFVAMLLDALDGRVARLTHSQSEFGAQLDSLSDLICFGLTPSLVFYNWALSTLGKSGWLAAFIFTVCAALRLARFNSQSESDDKRYFRGLSTTAAAGFMAGVLWVGSDYGFDGHRYAVCLAVLTVMVGLLEVSMFKYRSFKDIDMRGKVPFLVILLIVLVLVLISYNPPIMLCGVFGVYAFSGPVMWVWHFLFKSKQSNV